MTSTMEEDAFGLIHEGVRCMIGLVDPEPGREGVRETPVRVLKAFLEMTRGYLDDPAEILSTQFEGPHDEIVVLRGIEFVSLCEHHLLPFTGTATVGYLPGDRVVGLSKLARLVDCFARRLQIQERMTEQIAVALEAGVGARGVGVIVTGAHGCMTCRGVGKPNAVMVTSANLGAFRDSPSTRAEFMALARQP